VSHTVSVLLHQLSGMIYRNTCAVYTDGIGYAWPIRSPTEDVLVCEGQLARGVFMTHVRVRYMLSPVRLSSVCNARAPYLGGSNFRQFFYGIRYLGHPLTSTENFTEIVPGEPLRRGS